MSTKTRLRQGSALKSKLVQQTGEKCRNTNALFSKAMSLLERVNDTLETLYNRVGKLEIDRLTRKDADNIRELRTIYVQPFPANKTIGFSGNRIRTGQAYTHTEVSCNEKLRPAKNSDGEDV